jgi:DNA repair photolyase
MLGNEDVNMVAVEQHAKPINELRHKNYAKVGSGLKDDDKKESQDIEMNAPEVIEE